MTGIKQHTQKEESTTCWVEDMLLRCDNIDGLPPQERIEYGVENILRIAMNRDENKFHLRGWLNARNILIHIIKQIPNTELNNILKLLVEANKDNELTEILEL